jgi:hypothetical protein
MVLSVSRRTDIPAFYSNWFFQRVKEGFVMTRNPRNIHNISRIPINNDVIDCIVFWTKDPSKMISGLKNLGEIPFYFQFTLNAYPNGIEKNVPKKKILLGTFKKLSDIISPKRIIWRYDPILFTDKIGIDYHTKYYEDLAKRISGYSNTCTISFLDKYKRIEKNLNSARIRELTIDEINILSSRISLIAEKYSVNVLTCAEKYDLSNYGIRHGRCIDNKLIEEITGKKIFIKKDKNQREMCGCIESVDIGEYNSCHHNCIYCYANDHLKSSLQKTSEHNSFSALQMGVISKNDIIKTKTFLSNTDDNQLFQK